MNDSSLGDTQKGWAERIPDTYIILLILAVLAFLASHIVPAGSYEVLVDPETQRTVINPETFSYDESGSAAMPIFASGGNIGLLNVVFEGLVAGSKWGASIGVFAFILVAGGAFGIVTHTGSIDRGLQALIAKSQKTASLFIPVVFIGFALGGAVFGMGEEVIPFALIIIPVAIRLGFDSITGLLVTYVATQIGFAASWMNPFSVGIAQSIAGLPPLSGLEFRLVMWVIFVALGLAYTLWYARKVRARPLASLSYNSDASFRDEIDDHEEVKVPFAFGDWLVIGVLLATIGWMIWGVVFHEYFLPEIASQFFAMGIAAGVIGCVFKLDNMDVNGAANAFKHGAQELLPAAMVVAIAKGIVLLLGGDDPESASVLNTVLYSVSGLVGELPQVIAAWCMLMFQSVFNFFVTSGSGQAALTMPLMAPLGDLVGVSRQTAVLSFQLGDGLTNIMVPTSAALMGCLGAARLDWSVWIRFVLPLQGILFSAASIVVIVAALINF